MRAVLIHLRPIDPATGQRVDVYVGDAPGAQYLGLGGQRWEAVVTKRPLRTIDLVSLELDGRTQLPSARFELNLGRVRSHPRPLALTWKGAPLAIWLVDQLDWVSREPFFMGRVATPRLNSDSRLLSIEAIADMKDLARPILYASFAGSGGLGGDAAKRGVLLPAGFGVVKNIQPVWFDETRNIGMIDGYGNTLSIDWLGEGLSSFGARQADYATYAALAAAIDAKTVKPGQWATCVAQGLVGLGAPPAGIITVHAVFGYGLTGALMRRLMTAHAVIDPARIITSSFDALDIAYPLPVHYWTQTQRTVADMVESLAAPMLATPVMLFEGRFALTSVLGGAIGMTLDYSGAQIPRVVNYEIGQHDSPYFRLRARGVRPASTLTRDEVMFLDDIDDRGQYDNAVIYRLGQSVVMPDKSEWLYINTTPSSGHQPPYAAQPPVTSDAWWERIIDPITAINVRFGDGTTVESIQVPFLAMLDDSILSRVEKPEFVDRWSRVGIERSGLDAKAATFGSVAAQRTALTNAYNALATAIASITPAYNNMATDSPVPSDLQAKFDAYYSAFSTLQLAINAVTLVVQWAVSDSGPWHTTYVAGDKWQRYSLDNGATYSAAVKVVGEDGSPAITGLLTNESATLAANAAGVVADFSTATGQFKVFVGALDRTGDATFSLVGTTGATASINLVGAYSVTAMSAANAIVTFRAAIPGFPNIDKQMTLSKAVAGAGAKLLTISSDRQTITYSAAGAVSPSSQTSVFTATRQNSTATVNWTMTRLDGTALSAATYLSATTGLSVSMTAANFETARGATNGVIVIATIVDGITISDQISVVKIQTGATGASAIVGFLSNESTVFAAAADGTVSSFTSANGNFKVFEGATDVSASATFSLVGTTGATASINLVGAYSVTAMSAANAIVTFRAAIPGFPNIDKQMTLSKAVAGADAKLLTISSDRQTITYASAGTLDPSSQTTTFTAAKQNSTATVSWTIKRVDGTVLTPATYLSATTGDSVTMTAANFEAARAATTGVIVTGTMTDGGTLSDQISIVKVQAGAIGPYQSRVYRRAATQPATPTISTGDPPPGWSDGPPADDGTPLWETYADFQNGVQLVAWSTPVRLLPGGIQPGATADVTMVPLAGEALAIFGNDVSRNAGTAWDNIAISVERMVGNARMGFELRGDRTFAGLKATTSVPNPTTVWDSIDYAVNRVSQDTPDIWVIRELGVVIEDLGTAKSGVTFGDSTRWEIVYYGTTVLYFADSVLMRLSTTSAGRTFSAAAAPYGPTSLIRAITFAPYADITALNQITMTTSGDTVIQCDYLGEALTGELPEIISFQMLRGTDDISEFVPWALVTPRTGLAINNIADGTRGVVTVSTIISASETVIVKATINGMDFYSSATIRTNNAPPPTGGDSGGGGAGTTASTSVTHPSTPTGSTTHVDASAVISCIVGANGKVKATCTFTVRQVLGQEIDELTGAVQALYSANGTSGWSVIGNEQGSSAATRWYSVEVPKGSRETYGNGTLNREKTGLTPGSTAYVKYQARKSSGNNNMQSLNGYGTITGS